MCEYLENKNYLNEVIISTKINIEVLKMQTREFLNYYLNHICIRSDPKKHILYEFFLTHNMTSR